jgi:hypothetical protein
MVGALCTVVIIITIPLWVGKICTVGLEQAENADLEDCGHMVSGDAGCIPSPDALAGQDDTSRGRADGTIKVGDRIIRECLPCDTACCVNPELTAARATAEVRQLHAFLPRSISVWSAVWPRGHTEFTEADEA